MEFLALRIEKQGGRVFGDSIFAAELFRRGTVFRVEFQRDETTLYRLGNVFFAKAVSWVIDAPIGDSLCGTKVISRLDHQRVTRWIAAEFADCDPFGDFELLFGAATLGLGIIDVPIRYRDRAYGSTQIHRWSHGLMLARTTWLGLRKLKLGRA